MPGHMTTLGFPVTTEKDFRHYVFEASEFGQKIESPNGSYTLWALGNGIELWVQTNLHKRIIGMNLHFSGHSRMKVGLSKRIVRIRQSILDGALYAWADPQRDNPESGHYPFVFDLPDYDLHNDVPIPSIASIQLAAFAHELQGFESEGAYMTAQSSGIRWAAESFIPSGLFTSGPGEASPYGWGNHKGYRNLLPGCKRVYNQGGFEPIYIHSRKEDLHSWHYHK